MVLERVQRERSPPRGCWSCGRRCGRRAGSAARYATLVIGSRLAARHAAAPKSPCCSGRSAHAKIETMAQRHGQAVTAWLRIVGELEASRRSPRRLRHPSVRFRGRAGRREDANLSGAARAPADSRARAVASDIRLAVDAALPTPPVPQALIVSGSSMSGSRRCCNGVGSTPCSRSRARRCARAPAYRRCHRRTRCRFRIPAGSRSLLHAEITRAGAGRFRRAGSHALPFLLDELFHGTNSRSRRRRARRRNLCSITPSVS